MLNLDSCKVLALGCNDSYLVGDFRLLITVQASQCWVSFCITLHCIFWDVASHCCPLEKETWSVVLINLDHETQYGQVQQKHLG